MIIIPWINGLLVFFPRCFSIKVYPDLRLPCPGGSSQLASVSVYLQIIKHHASCFLTPAGYTYNIPYLGCMWILLSDIYIYIEKVVLNVE